MALTKIGTDGIKDDAVTLSKQAAGTDGQIITYDASGNPVAVGPGTDGQVLTSTGAGSPPAFETLPASNNYTHPNHSGEVTSTADGAQVIADDVVDEANLKVSNSPTNGYFLQAQSGNTGGLTWAEAGGGKILQVVSANFTSQFAHAASSGTGWQATNITLDITPTSASSKIYIRSDFNIWKSGSSAQVNMTLYRDSTNLGGSFYGFGEFVVNAAYALQWNMAYNDSPNTTSQITYKVYARVQSGHHFNMGVNNVPTNITAWEYST